MVSKLPLILIVAIMLLSGCQTLDKTKSSAAATKELYAGPGIEETNWKEDSETHRNLISLPMPRGKILVSAYGFKDQSGQYKPSPSSTFSTAVSQGANAILIKALRDSRWFVPIEREGLQNLLTERKIIRATLRGTNKDIPPLLGASILLEGGIIGYDTNIKTGGAGAKYFGVGAAEQYRVDQVTVSLRAIDISSGKIINTVVVRKSIFSRESTAGFFRFVKFKRLLEMEAGYTRNEPAQLALVDAIETAVLRLITNGLHENLWSLANPQDIVHPIIQLYSDDPQKAPVQATPTTLASNPQPAQNQQQPSNQQRNAQQASHQQVATATRPNTPPVRRGRPVGQPSSGNQNIGQPKQAQPTNLNQTQRTPAPATQRGNAPNTLAIAATTAAKAAAPTKPKATLPQRKVVPPPITAAKPLEVLNDQTDLPLERVYAVSNNPIAKANFYAIQLISSSKANDLIDFLTNTSADRNQFIYITYILNGQEKFALLYGVYPDKGKAKAAISELPAEMKVHKPWVRLVSNHS